MQRRKVVLVLLAVAGVYFVAAGGLPATLHAPGGLASVLFSPLQHGTPFDVGILMMSALLLTWAFLSRPEGTGIKKPQVLLGVGVGSGLILGGSLLLVVSQHGSDPDPQLLGVLTLIAVAQGAVGLLAGLLLFCRKENRKLAFLPVGLNGSLMAVAVLFLLGGFLN